MPEVTSLSNDFALIILVIIVSAIITDCARDIRQLVSARNVFLLTILAWFVFEATIVPEELNVFSQSTYNYSLVCVLLCGMAFLAGYRASRGGVFDPLFRRLGQIDSPKTIWTVFAFACAAGFLPLFFITRGNPLPILEDAFLPKSRWSGPFQRGRYGGVRDAFLELQMFLRAAIPLAAAVIVLAKQPATRRLVAGCFLTFMFARAFNSGTRSQVVEVFMPIAAAIYWRMSPSIKKRALTFGLPILVVTGLIWSAATVIGRNDGRVDWEQATSAKYVGFEMFREVMFITEAVPERSDYKWGRTYYVQLINPIPRALWPDKPDDDAGLELARFKGLVAGGRAFLTVSPGLIGEMYWNFGIIGVIFVSGFLGYLAKSWDRVRPIAQHSVLAFTVFAAGLAVIFLSGRSVSMPILYGMLALFVLLILFAKRGKSRSRRGVQSTPALQRDAP